MGGGMDMKLNNETVIPPFQKELFEIIDGFGYEWKGTGNDIVLNLDKRNLPSDDAVKFIERFIPKPSDPQHKKQIDLMSKYVTSRLTHLKLSGIKEIFADLALFVIFLWILYHFIFVTFTLLGVALDLLVIATLVRSFISSINEILLSDQTLLSKKYGFTKTDRGFVTSRYNVLKELKRSKYMSLFLSAVLLTISILSFTFPNPPLIYVTSVINFTALLLASLHMGFQYYWNWKKQKKIKSLKPTLLAVVLVFLFFFVYVLNYFIYYTPIAFISAFFVDIIVIYSVPYFARDLIRINRFRKWSDSNLDIQ
jgi:hypothetical protein